RVKQMLIMGGGGTARFHETDHRVQPVDGGRKPRQLRRPRYRSLARRLHGNDRLQGEAAGRDAREDPEGSRDREGARRHRYPIPYGRDAATQARPGVLGVAPGGGNLAADDVHAPATEVIRIRVMMDLLARPLVAQSTVVEPPHA